MNFDQLKTRFQWVKKSPYSLFIYNEIKRRSRFFTFSNLDDKQAIEELYKRYTGREIDWVNHKRFTEKLQLLKFYYSKDPFIGKLVDKYRVREYIEQKGYGQTLNTLIGAWTNVNDIKLDQLPEKFVLKAAHGSSWNIICKDKRELEKRWRIYKKLMNSWLKQDLSVYGREGFFHFAEPRIICEQFLQDKSGALIDYKFFCFNGKVKFIQVDFDRYGDWRKNFYTENWDMFDLQTSKPHFNDDGFKPKNLEAMVAMAKDFSKDYPYLRVDLYEVDGRIVFGELTFIDGCGFYTFNPDEYDFIMGEWLELPDSIEDYVQ